MIFFDRIVSNRIGIVSNRISKEHAVDTADVFVVVEIRVLVLLDMESVDEGVKILLG
jgi:hypothetical protein